MKSKNIKEFILTLPRNLKVIIARFSLAYFVGSLNPYGSVYIVALGATGTELGLLNSISLAFTCLFVFLTGWISDCSDRKRMFLIGASLGALVPLIYASATGWTLLILAFLLNGVSEGFIQPAWNSLYANNVSNENRASIYGLVTVFALTPSLLAGIIGGAIVSALGGLTVEAIRPLYFIQASLLIIALILIWRYMKSEDSEKKLPKISISRMVNDYREVLSLKGARNWAFMKSLGSLSVGLAGPFWMLYAAMYKEASAMTMAYMITLRSLTNIMLSPFFGRISDRVGRKTMILSGRVVMYIGTAVFMVSSAEWMLIIAWVFQGISDATQVAWQAEEVELVGSHQRARMTALSIGSFNILAVPASIIGGWLWDDVSPLAPFIVMVIIDALIRMPIIYLMVPEGRKVEDGEIKSK
jgi:MFS family permease